MPVRMIFGSYSFVCLFLLMIAFGVANLFFLGNRANPSTDFPTFIDTGLLFEQSLDAGEDVFYDGEFTAAVFWFERALLLAVTQNERATAHFLLAISHQARGDARSAIAHFESTLLYLHPQSPDRHVVLGMLARYQDDMVTAFAEFEAALAADPHNFYANNTLGDIFHGDSDQTLRDYRRALAYHLAALDHAPDPQSAHKAVAFDLLALGDYEGATEYFGQALAFDETDSESRFLLGMTQLLRFDDVDEAVIELRQASTLRPEYRAIFERIIIFAS